MNRPPFDESDDRSPLSQQLLAQMFKAQPSEIRFTFPTGLRLTLEFPRLPGEDAEDATD